MARNQKALAKDVLDQFGRTWADELGINIARNSPAELWKLLTFAVLASTRISHDAALKAARALFDEGWTTARKMSASTWEQRTRTLNQHGYARYDESTSRYLGYNAEMAQNEYGGDLRRLRERAERKPDAERDLLKQFKGIGDVGADIFFREVQLVWDELFPFADERTVRGAGQIGLPTDGRKLAGLVSRQDFPRLTAGLIRMQFAKAQQQIKRAA